MAHVINFNDFSPSAAPNLIARLRQAYADFRAYLATTGELKALSDRELADLGLSRLSVEDVAREAVYGK